jgi:hypothetical protein
MTARRRALRAVAVGPTQTKMFSSVRSVVVVGFMGYVGVRGEEDMIDTVLRCTTPCAWMSERVRASCRATGRTLRSEILPLLMIQSRRESDWGCILAMLG